MLVVVTSAREISYAGAFTIMTAYSDDLLDTSSTAYSALRTLLRTQVRT